MLRQVTLELDMEREMQTIASEEGVSLRVADCRFMNGNSMTMLLELEGQTGSLELATRRLRKASWMKQMHLTEVSGTKSLALSVVDRPPVCESSVGVGVVCMTCPYGQAGSTVTWQLLVRGADDVRSLMSHLEKNGVGARIVSISKVDHEETLTDRQREVVAAAVSLGYFDFPRKVGLTELSKRVGIKPSTLSEILRTAERKIIARAY